MQFAWGERRCEKDVVSRDKLQARIREKVKCLKGKRDNSEEKSGKSTLELSLHKGKKGKTRSRFLVIELGKKTDEKLGSGKWWKRRERETECKLSLTQERGDRRRRG